MESPSKESNSPGAEPPDSGQKANDERLASRFAELARRDKRIREEKKRLAEEKAQLQRWQEAERLAKEDPLAVLERLGLSYEQLTERQFERFAQQAQADDPVQRVKSIEEKIAAYEEQAKKQAEEAQRAQVEQQLAQFQRQIVERIEADPDRFELVVTQQAHEDVYRLIEAHFAETREVMSIERAAELVESQLYEEAQGFLKAKKLREKLAADSQEQRVEDSTDSPNGMQRAEVQNRTSLHSSETERSAAPSPPVTLTNSNTVASQAGMPKPAFDIEESKRRAVAMLKFK